MCRQKKITRVCKRASRKKSCKASKKNWNISFIITVVVFAHSFSFSLSLTLSRDDNEKISLWKIFSHLFLYSHPWCSVKEALRVKQSTEKNWLIIWVTQNWARKIVSLKRKEKWWVCRATCWPAGRLAWIQETAAETVTVTDTPERTLQLSSAHD